MTTPSAIRKLLEAKGIAPKRSLGQNFLANSRVIDRLLEVAGIGSWDHVVEIGTGPGHITREIAARAARVIGIELDAALAEIATEMVAPLPNAQIVHADGEQFARHVPAEGTWMVFSNLPYASIQKLMPAIFGAPERVTAAVLMVQTEVFAKLAAEPGTREYGPLAVLARGTGNVSRLMRVSAAGFYPRPHVSSDVFRWDRREPFVSREALDAAQRELQGIFRRRRRRQERELIKLEPRALLGRVTA